MLKEREDIRLLFHEMMQKRMFKNSVKIHTSFKKKTQKKIFFRKSWICFTKNKKKHTETNKEKWNYNGRLKPATAKYRNAIDMSFLSDNTGNEEIEKHYDVFKEGAFEKWIRTINEWNLNQLLDKEDLLYSNRFATPEKMEQFKFYNRQKYHQNIKLKRDESGNPIWMGTNPTG